jgi:hypothetical protein
MTKTRTKTATQKIKNISRKIDRATAQSKSPVSQYSVQDIERILTVVMFAAVSVAAVLLTLAVLVAAAKA